MIDLLILSDRGDTNEAISEPGILAVMILGDLVSIPASIADDDDHFRSSHL